MMRRGRTSRSRYWISRTDEIFRRLVEKGFLTQDEADAERPYELRWEDGTYVDPKKVEATEIQPAQKP